MSNLVNDGDLNLAKSQLKSIISNVRLGVAFVVDSNHDGSSNNSIPIGGVVAKTFDLVNTSELVDSVYTPINANLSHYPVAGEYVLTVSHEIGNYYLSVINLSNNINNNIDFDNMSGFVEYSDDVDINKKTIKSDRRSTQNVLEKNGRFFNEVDNLAQYRSVKQFGDVVLSGRFGNSVNLTHSTNGNALTAIRNGGTWIDMITDSFVYEENTKKINFNKTTQSKIGVDYSSDSLIIRSGRMILQSGIGGMLFQTPSVISFSTDDNFTIDSARTTSIKSNRVDLGYNSTELINDENPQQVMLGNNFVNDFKKFVILFENFMDNIADDNDSVSLTIGSQVARNSLTRLKWNMSDIETTFDRYLSKKVFLK